MAKTLPSSLIIEKNKLSQKSPWLILLEVVLVNPSNPEATETYRLVRNFEDITYNSDTYTAFAFDMEPTKYTSKGEIPIVSLRVSNVSQLLQAKVEEYDGAVGSLVTMTVVHTDNLTENFADLELIFEIMDTITDVDWITFLLGAPNPLRSRFPLDRYVPTHCNWLFKSVECAYVGGETVCNRTYADCVIRGQEERFGGFLGLRSGYLRVI